MLEGSRAVALVVKNIRPAVVSAYPITPQTHIVEDLAQFKADGQAAYEYSRAESEFAAASIILGASAAGVRVYSATSSQGLLLMTEVLYNISGMRLPVVMTCANRAVSAPINIWCDHSDTMSVRDAGWIQLFASDNQEAVNQHILAYKLAERLKLPVMVNMDGFILTHSYEAVVIPSSAEIKKYLPDYRPLKDTYLDPKNPLTLGAFFTPEDYLETRSALHEDLRGALKTIKEEYAAFQKTVAAGQTKEKNGGRGYQDNGLIEYSGPKKPETVIVALGSVIGTIRAAVVNDPKVGVLKIKTYRPFPGEEIASLIKGVKNIAVLEKAISLGHSGPVYADLKSALPAGHKINVKNYIVGLGGRDITEKMIIAIAKDARRAARGEDFVQFIGKI